VRDVAVLGGRRVGTSAPTLVLVLVALAAALNLVGGYLAGLVRLPVFLDTVGTCVAAIALGPWWGALAGALSNIVGALWYGPTNIPFALVNVAAALVWGYGVRTFGMGRGAIRYFVLNLVVALVTAVVAAPIVLFVSGGSTGHASDLVTAAFAQAGLVVAVLASNILVAPLDKLLAGYTGAAIVRALPAHLRNGADLSGVSGGRAVIVAAVAIVVGLALLLANTVLNPPAA
jgi:energy-coupling factor transport system substrate-specific component